MNLRQAGYVLEILEEGSISAAAKKLFISQPALSQTLRLAEKQLGAPIFKRTASPIALTYAGERYVHAARQMLLIEENLRGEMDEFNREERGRLCFGISRQRGIDIIPAVLTTFRARFPLVALTLEEHGSQVLEDLTDRGVVDLALASTVPRRETLEYKPVEEEQLALLCDSRTVLAQSLAPGAPVASIVDAAGEAFVLLKTGHGVRTIQDQLFAAHNISPHVLLETDSFDTAMQVAVRCGGVMLCPHIYLHNAAAALPGCAIHPLPRTGFERGSYFCWRKGVYLPRYTRAWIEAIEQQIQAGSRPAQEDAP